MLEKLSSVDRLEQEVRLLREQVERQNDLIAELVGHPLEQGKQDKPLEPLRLSYR